jgi:hypothetical protein
MIVAVIALLPVILALTDLSLASGCRGRPEALVTAHHSIAIVNLMAHLEFPAYAEFRCRRKHRILLKNSII